MGESRCLVIPAIKKNTVIPDQLLKKLAGEPLITRAINTALACVPARDIIILTDSEEIALICQRSGVRHVLNDAFRFQGYDIVAEMREFLGLLAREYGHCIILRPSCPLLTWVDIEGAWKKYRTAGAQCLITVRNVRQRIWKNRDEALEDVLAGLGGLEAEQKSYVVETRALVMVDLNAILEKRALTRVIPWFLEERGLEIQNYQDWWICERLLERRHVVFVVAGYPAIGMGHVYRALMLAHEISSHKITFVCTRASELAVESVASRDYHVIRQGGEPLAATVLRQVPDLVINDFLNTPVDYMRKIKNAGPRVINFEDDGPGSEYADLVINALYEKDVSTSRLRFGPEYFCLRDEFVYARRNPLREGVKVLLITFGGTDQRNFTLRTLDIVEPVCRAFGIAIRIVTGPGYEHRESLEKKLAQLANPLVTFTWATNIMSRMMEGADLAICSAGRTVYELAHMRVPGMVLATHDREARHTFARPRHGFAFVGLMDKVDNRRIRNVFLAMCKQKRRALYWERQNKLSFAGNKQRVVGLMEDELEKSVHSAPFQGWE